MENVIRVDARKKAAGKTLYTDDYKIPGMWLGAILTSPVDRGRIVELTLPRTADAVFVTAADIPGENIVPEPVSDELFFATDELFYRGQPIAAVACGTAERLRELLAAIVLRVEPLPALTDPNTALDDEGNVFGHEILIDHGPNQAPDPGWVHLLGVYRTAHQEQAYLEPQGVIATYHPDRSEMRILGSMQCPYFVKEGVEAIMGDTIGEAVVEVSEGVGGAFGGKEDFPSLLSGIAALLAYKSRKPVKLVLDRAQDFKMTTKRHPSRTEIESWSDPATGEIRKMRVDFRLDAGYYQTLSPVVLSRGALHAGGAYHHRDTRVLARLLRSNTPPNGAFRGFGAPQSLFAVEAHIDDLARRLGKTPLEIRRANLIRPGGVFPTTQVIREDHLHELLIEVLKWSDYERKLREYAEYNRAHDDKLGVGLSLGMHGGGYTGNGERFLDSEVRVRIESDGLARVFVSNVDMGQGCATTLAQMFARELRHPLELTVYQRPDTSKTPNSGPTVASRTIYVVGGILRRLARRISGEIGGQTLLESIRRNPETYPREYRQKYEPDPSVVFDADTYKGMGYRDYSWAASMADIRYLADERRIFPREFYTVVDIGEPVNPQIAEGQVEGGIAQAFGWALTEWVHKPGLGRLSGLTDYSAPTSLDLPAIRVRFLHTDSNVAKGLGELPMDFPAPALRNALLNATGIAVPELPLTPETILRYSRRRA
jgi:CO/xanthine dehydrogenase Mo-binding subunit